jgi:serine/threonine-protein kinase
VIPPGLAFCSQCGATVAPSAESDPLLDQVRALFGRDLEIDRELGRGAMAVVYGGYDPALQRRVAVKVLLPELAEVPELTERFRREARMVAALQHPNVVSVYSVRNDDMVSAIVMQFVEGRSLDVALAEQPMLPLPVAGLVLAQAASALQHAHERGIVHRDIKPANVLLGNDGRAIVSDFGIARRQGGAKLTGTGVMLGTVAYMSPEQCSTETVTPQSDQYSLGVMAFELLTGSTPFRGNVAQVITAHIRQPAPPLADLRSDLPSAVVSYVMRMLEKDPNARHPDLRDAEHVFRALVRDAKAASTIVAAMSSVHPRPPGASVVMRAAAPTVKAPAIAPPAPAQEPPSVAVPPPVAAIDAPEKAQEQAPRRAGLYIAGAAGLLAIVGAATWMATRSRTAGTSAATNLSTPSAAAATSRDSANERATAAIPDGNRLPTVAVQGGAGGASVPPARGAGGTAAAPAVPGPDAVAKPDPQAVRDSAAAPAAVAPTVAPAASVTGAIAALADARAVAREFVTICNQRRAGDLETLGLLDGDPALRTELLRLVRSAPELGAGFDRVASAPRVSGDRFTTDFVLDLQWRGGHKLTLVRVQAALQNGVWRATAFGVSAPE